MVLLSGRKGQNSRPYGYNVFLVEEANLTRHLTFTIAGSILNIIQERGLEQFGVRSFSFGAI